MSNINWLNVIFISAIILCTIYKDKKRYKSASKVQKKPSNNKEFSFKRTQKPINKKSEQNIKHPTSVIHKRCSFCGITYQATEKFFPSETGKCNACVQQNSCKESRILQTSAHDISSAVTEIQYKKCAPGRNYKKQLKGNYCYNEFPMTSEYFGHVKGKGFRGQCRECKRRDTHAAHINDPSKSKERNVRRKSAESNAIGTYTKEDIITIRQQVGDNCFYCGKPLHKKGEIDHKIPLIRGGTNFPSNLTLACGKCNKAKRDKTDSEFWKYREEKGLKCRV